MANRQKFLESLKQLSDSRTDSQVIEDAIKEYKSSKTDWKVVFSQAIKDKNMKSKLIAWLKTNSLDGRVFNTNEEIEQFLKEINNNNNKE
ncbi:hypothetical protein [Burkholderia cepacia]|uniref:hypothetical protein n=1 Tax=Burkholderia cepacia TaxID=292 RepID=UPI00158F374C|nr:hypothetical protein [Burkholderia cepacia]